MTSIALRLFEEAVRYSGLHLENDLADSAYWSTMPLHQRAIVLLFLVDRGLVEADGSREDAACSSRSRMPSRGWKASPPCSPTSGRRSSSWPLFVASSSGELIPDPA